MNITFPIDTIPFIVALALEFISPLTARRTEHHIERGLKYVLANEGQINDIKDYVSYAVDSLQVISSIILSLVSIIVLPFFRQEFEFGIIISVALVSLLFCAWYYFEKVGANRHQLFGLGPYGWVSLLTIFLNFFIISLILSPLSTFYYLTYSLCFWLPYIIIKRS
jgi:hypothetical protein